MQIIKPQTGDFYIYSLGRVTSNQEKFPNKSRRTLTEFGPVVLCARVFIQDPHIGYPMWWYPFPMIIYTWT